MATLTWYGRVFVDAKLAILHQERIEDIETETFNRIIQAHLADGWRKIYVYDNFDAWIDYGRVDLRRGWSKLVFEWDNWMEGEITGPPRLIREIARAYGLQPVKWRRLRRAPK